MKKLSLLIVILGTLFSSSCTHTPVIDQNKETVILLHGFGRSKFARSLANKMQSGGFNVVSIDYSSLNQDITGIKSEVEEKIDNALLKIPKKAVHFVGHSLGGLLVRSYLDNKKVELLSNVVIMGSPKQGD